MDSQTEARSERGDKRPRSPFSIPTESMDCGHDDPMLSVSDELFNTGFEESMSRSEPLSRVVNPIAQQTF